MSSYLTDLAAKMAAAEKGNRFTDYISTIGGRVVVSTCVAMDTGRYETCLFDESRIRATVAAATGVTGDLWPRHSEVIATYGTDADAAERGHRMIAAALRFTIAPEGDND